MQKIKVWDLPLRLFHWLLVACVTVLFVTGQLGGNLIEIHAKFGIAVAGLLGFRLAWGFLGSTNARFLSFLPSPAKIRAYLRGEWHGVGHNPLGALSVFALLGLLLVQVSSGLCANDDISFRGPLADLVSDALSGRLTGLHHLVADGLMILVGLHIAAIVFYARFKKHNLLLPMLTGWSEDEGTSASGGGLVALLVALVFAGLVVWGASGAWLPPPPPPAPAATTPAW
jgi:cytochrome b